MSMCINSRHNYLVLAYVKSTEKIFCVLMQFYNFVWQADVEVSFEVSDLKKVEVLKKKHYNPQLLCSKNSASMRGGLGPFGFLTFASNCLREYTAVFFRIYNHRNKHKVLMCSDQSRLTIIIKILLSFATFSVIVTLQIPNWIDYFI